MWTTRERLKSNPHVNIIKDVLDVEDGVTYAGDFAGPDRLLGVQVLLVQVEDLRNQNMIFVGNVGSVSETAHTIQGREA